MAAQLLQAREFIVSLATKADDSNKLLPNDVPGNRHIRSVSQIGNDPRRKRFVLEPALGEQAAQVYAMYNKAWKDGGWCVYTDELFYAETELKVGRINRTLLTQGRSRGITMVNGIQRPSMVSRFAMSEPTHIVCGRMEGRDIKTVCDSTTANIRKPLEALQRYEFLWYHRAENSFRVINLDSVQGKGDSQKA